MLPRPLWILCLAALGVQAQSETGTGSSTEASSTASSSTSSSSSSGTTESAEFTNSGIRTISSTVRVSDFSGSQYTYVTSDGQKTVTTTGPRIIVSGGQTVTVNSENATASTSSNSQITRTTNTNELTQIVGGSNRTMTATGTSSAPAVSNTAACNNYPEFCNRKYSNITEVCAHNAAFAIPRNAASNQELGIIDQLNDGVRMRMSSPIHPIAPSDY
jgi:hypothetical protein